MRSLFATAMLGCTLLSGCGDDVGGRQEIAGTVTLQGQPLDDGSIEFTPLGAPQAGTTETRSGAPIMAGKYNIPREHGLVPGHYRVRISAPTSVATPGEDELPGPTFGPPPKERVPAGYNVNSKLEATVRDSGLNTFDFAIP